jgi:MFS family permease
MLSLLTTAMMGAWAFTQIPLGRVVDRVGYRRFLAVAQSIGCGTLLLLLASKRLEVVLISQIIIGVSAGMWVPAEEAWIASNVAPEERGQAIASYSTFRGLLSFPAPFIGGALYDAFGFNVPILLNLIGAFIDVILIVLFVKEKVVQQ